MGRLIDADKAIRNMQYYHDDCAKTSVYTKLGFETAMEVVKSAPTVEAIPIPKGATNGDIMRTIFPKAKHELQKFYEEDTIVFDLDGFYMRISSDWWNSPYKE